jgi:hypothetical protein
MAPLSLFADPRPNVLPGGEEVEAQLEAQQRRGVEVVVATVPLPNFDEKPLTSTPTAAASPNSCLHRAPTSLQSELGRAGLLARPSSAAPWSSTSALSNARSRRATHFPFAVAISYSTFGPSRCFTPPAPVGAQRGGDRAANSAEDLLVGGRCRDGTSARAVECGPNGWSYIAC